MATRVEVFIYEVVSPESSQNLVMRGFLNGQLVSVEYPFEESMVFKANSVGEEELLLSLEENGNEVSFCEVKVVEGEAWYSMTSRRTSRGTTSQLENPYTVRLNIVETHSLNPNCNRCPYLQRLSLIQQKELQRSQELAASNKDVKLILEEMVSNERLSVAEEDPQFGEKVPDSEVQHLKEVLEGLMTKLEGVASIQSQLKETRNKLFQSQNKRLQNSEEITSNTKSLIEKTKKESLKRSDLIAKLESVFDDLNARKTNSQTKETLKTKLTSQLNNNLATQEKVKSDNYNKEFLENHIQSISTQIQNCRNNIQQLQQVKEESTNHFLQQKTNQTQNQERLQTEKDSLLKEISSTESLLSDQRSKNELLKTENQETAESIKALKNKIATFKQKNQEITNSKESALSNEKACIETQNKIYEEAMSFKSQLEQLISENQELLNQKQKTIQNLSNLENQLSQNKSESYSLNQTTLNLLRDSTIIQHKLTIQEDKKEAHSSLTKISDLEQTVSKLLNQTIQTMQQRLEEKSNQLNNHISELRKVQLESHNYTASKAEFLGKLKKLEKEKEVYTPVSEDLDKEVASVINSTQGWPLVGFKRLGEGQYMLGKKPLEAYLEEEVKVKVDEGNMPFTEFLSTYLPLQIRKVQLYPSNI